MRESGFAGHLVNAAHTKIKTADHQWRFVILHDQDFKAVGKNMLFDGYQLFAAGKKDQKKGKGGTGKEIGKGAEILYIRICI